MKITQDNDGLHVYFPAKDGRGSYNNGTLDWIFSISPAGKLDWNDSLVPDVNDCRLIIDIVDNRSKYLLRAEPVSAVVFDMENV